MKRNYLGFDSLRAYPRGKSVFYECEKCGDTIPSYPDDGIVCSCRNIFIDVDAGRVSVEDETKLKIFEK